MTKKYNLCFDVLTILSCLMVVFFHCNGIINTYSDTISWKISVVERTVVYSAIPIFFMLTGAKLMNYRSRYTTKEYLKKRLQRVGVPFIFWNLFYVAYRFLLGPVKPGNSVKELLSMFFNSEFQSRFWFFWPLFAIYFAIPVISLVLQAKNHRKYLWYAVYMTFGLNFVLRPIMGITGIRYNSYMLFPVCGGFMMYALFGYLISTESWSRAKRITLYLSAFLSGMFACIFTIYRSGVAGETKTYMLSYEFFPSALTGAAIFVFVKHLFENSPRLSAPSENSRTVKLIRAASEDCMGVWLTHSLGIMVLTTLIHLNPAGYVFRFLCPIIVFLGCMIGVHIVKKIPYIGRIV